jgi:hypothetical protein
MFLLLVLFPFVLVISTGVRNKLKSVTVQRVVHLHLDLATGLFPLGFPTNNFYIILLICSFDGFEPLTKVTTKISSFWHVKTCSFVNVQCNVLPPSSGSKCKLSKKQTAWFLLVTFLAYCSTREMETVRSSETSVTLYRTTRHYIPCDITLHLRHLYVRRQYVRLWRGA